eukprot:5814374-Ditylum_brightwellii.AAC.1
MPLWFDWKYFKNFTIPISSTVLSTPGVLNIWSTVQLPLMYVGGVFLLCLEVIKPYSPASARKFLISPSSR